MNLLPGASLVVVLAAAEIPPATVEAIGADYRGTVEQAFQSHCADCHGNMPSTLAEPARTTAGKKARKAHKRLDLDDGFPFGSKWDMPKLMTKIRKAVANDKMPPGKYMKQKGVTLSDADRKAIVDWATGAEALLEGAPR
jgi:mono/diheme cytochrome c family protein